MLQEDGMIYKPAYHYIGEEEMNVELLNRE